MFFLLVLVMSVPGAILSKFAAAKLDSKRSLMLALATASFVMTCIMLFVFTPNLKSLMYFAGSILGVVLGWVRFDGPLCDTRAYALLFCTDCTHPTKSLY